LTLQVDEGLKQEEAYREQLNACNEWKNALQITLEKVIQQCKGIERELNPISKEKLDQLKEQSDPQILSKEASKSEANLKASLIKVEREIREMNKSGQTSHMYDFYIR